MERDFTYVEDIAQGVIKVVENKINKRSKSKEFYKVYNIGYNKSVSLLDFITEIEINLKIMSKKNLLAIQPGDVIATWANIDNLISDFGYRPKTNLKQGVKQYIKWYLEYYNKNEN